LGLVICGIRVEYDLFWKKLVWNKTVNILTRGIVSGDF
jgi:hypothetical protein